MIEPLVVARAINDVGALSLVGALVFRAVVLGPVLALLSGAQGRYVARSIDRLVWASLVLAGIGDLGWLAIQTGEMTGEAFPGALSSLPVVIKATHFGRVAALRLGLLLLTGLCELAVHRRRGTVTPVVLGLAASGAAVAAQAWAGHAVAVAGPAGATLLVSQVVHMLAAGAWVGGLLPLVRLLAVTDLGAAASLAARRFSSLGIACVAALAVTAAVNAWFLVGSFPALLGTPYGRDSLIKLGLFLAMLGLAALNRFQFTPRLATAAGAIGPLRRSATAEALLGLAVLIVAAQLASTPPGAHAQPWWPLPRRFSTVALELPGVDLELLAWACGALGGVLLAASAIWLRRLRLVAVVVGLVVLVACLREPVRLLSVEAFPTSFWQSPTGYSAQSIALGARVFAENCVACHGIRGQGDGPLAKGLRLPSADLTAEHVYDHSDGDLFWWISHGMADGAMPGFAVALAEPQRWSLIDFIHANADGARLAGAVAAESPRRLRAPDFTADCPAIGTTDLVALRGKVVHLVFAGPASSTRIRQLADQPVGVVSPPVTIVHNLPAALRGGRLCDASDPSLPTAYALFDGRGETAVDGSEFLIDAAGWLRATWHPGVTPAWTDPGVLRARIEAIVGTPLVAPTSPSMHHH